MGNLMTRHCLHILLAEDNPAHAEAIRRAFQTSRTPVELRVAQTLGEYQELLENKPPDIAILDLNLPDGRAVDVLISPAEVGRFPVLIMTSHGDEQVAVQAMKAGALDYIVKSPESFSTMPRMVEQALKEWFLRQGRRQDELKIMHLNSVLRGIRSVNQLIMRGEGITPLLQEACDRLVETIGYRAAWIAIHVEGGQRLAAHAGLPTELAILLEQQIEQGVMPPCAHRAFTEDNVFSKSLPQEECWDCALEGAYPTCGMLAASMEYRDHVYGVMVAAVSQPFVFDKEEQSLFHELVADLSFALYRLDLEKQHQATEEALHNVLASQRLSAERWQATFDAISDTVCVVSNDLRIVEINQVGCKTWGLSRDQIVGRPYFELIHDTTMPGIDGTMPTQPGIPATTRHEENGKVYDMLARPITESDGKSNGFVYIIKDVTADVAAAKEKQQLEDHLSLSQRLEAIGRLAGGVAHDFNNLLSVIIGYAGLAEEALHDSDPVRPSIVEIQKAGQRAATLTRQLLAFSRNQVLEPHVLSLNKVLSGIESMLRRLLGEDIHIDIHLAENVGGVMADPGQIEQVIMNLAVNARDAMPQGGKLILETADVELDESYAEQHISVTPGRFVMLSVTDSGTGIDAATQEHIFEPFFTTKERGRGSGLGLSTVYGIVKQSGGNIWVYSEIGHGTTFKVYLPRVEATPTDERPKPTPTLATGHETVLLVEDEDAVRGLAERILHGAGYKILTATGGADALRLYAAHGETIDLILTDVIMPQMSGRELAEQLAKLNPKLKVLYMSGYTDDAIVHHGVLDAGTRFIGKPFTIAELTRKVREVLDESASDVRSVP